MAMGGGAPSIAIAVAPIAADRPYRIDKIN
jgi:hypothetical protein